LSREEEEEEEKDGDTFKNLAHLVDQGQLVVVFEFVDGA
jgi:hypothetical protein